MGNNSGGIGLRLQSLAQAVGEPDGQRNGGKAWISRRTRRKDGEITDVNIAARDAEVAKFIIHQARFSDVAVLVRHLHAEAADFVGDASGPLHQNHPGR